MMSLVLAAAFQAPALACPSIQWPTNPAIEQRAPMPPLEVEDVARELHAAGEHFAALAVSIEGIATKPYWDGAGPNIGMGYCIRCRVASLGEEQVRADFHRAGLIESDVDTLLGSDRAALAQVELTVHQAVRLLGITESDYRTRARDIVGAGTFDRLPSHRQAALTWLSYNTGEGLVRFHRLLSAVRQGRHVDAMGELTPHFTHRGQRRANARAGAWLMAAYWSDEALAAALANPDKLEHHARIGGSPLDVVARADARRLSREGRLPRSPYIRPARESVSLAAVASPVENRQ